MTTKIISGDTKLFFEKLSKHKTDLFLYIVDGKIWQDYRNQIETNFPNKKVIVYTTPSGETAKSFQEYQKCIEFFLEKGIHRQAHVLAIGGGASSDLAGFVASTLLRGLEWSVMPTTLLSMVDAAIGGKVAINSKVGKNLVGNFHKPSTVFLDKSYLKSLPKEELQSGKGEILKYGLLDQEISSMILEDPSISIKLIEKCAEFKLSVTEDDFKESGKRKILNLGHTLGHAYEYIYRLNHGEAVVWGMVSLLYLFDESKAISRLNEMAKALEWTSEFPPWYNKTFPIDEIMNYVNKDKKLSNMEEIDLVLVKEIGKPTIVKFKLDELEKLLESKANELKQIKI